MRAIVFFLAISLLMSACAPGTTTSTGSPSARPSVSPEAEARTKTTQMKTALGLSEEQENKVLVINTVNAKLVRNLRESNQTDKLAATRQSYLKELQGILTPEQFAKYKQQFEGL